jgi:peroxiredoxin
MVTSLNPRTPPRSLAWGLILGLAPLGLGHPARAATNAYASDPAPGHSWHGEAFNTGPRQRAYLMEGMPRIQFPITTTNELAQQFFLQGVGQLHGFWYLEAERSFRRVHELDTNCAMSFWGMAMANARNDTRARTFVSNAVARATGAAPREQRYIEALREFYLVEERDGKKREQRQRRRDLVRAYEAIVQDYPDDIEAKAFLVYQIWDNSGFGNNTDLAISSQLAVDTLAWQVLEKDPKHPAHHYRIHVWDSEKPLNALLSAARCGQGSPGIAHMWHMPGHTYAKLSRHDDAAWQQEASARVDHAHMIRDRVLPDQIHNYAHNNDWLVESYGFVGRVRAAIDMAKNMIELPRLMKTNSAAETNPKAPRHDFASSSWLMGRNRLLQLLPRFELWDELLTLSGSPYLDATNLPDEQAKRARALALAWFAKGDPGQATNQLQILDHALDAIREERQGAVDFAEQTARNQNKPRPEITKAMTDAMERFNDRIDRLQSFAAEIRAYAAAASGDTNDFATFLAQAKDVPKERLALLHWQAGDKAKAESLAREAADAATNQVQQLASLTDLYWRLGKTNEAQEALQKLRQLRVQPDLDLPVIRRLAPVAQSLNLPVDSWPHLTPREDVGERPALESLGPLYWRPSPAPTWSLADASGRLRASSEFRGRPLVLLFYLGRGCVHCLEQLNAFAPQVAAFERGHIQVAAVSTDTIEGLQRTFRTGASEQPFPFPLLSDAPLETFKAFRAYDDFEDKPLHGTYLLDAEGMVRWQDIGYEPFMDVPFLLSEAQRLLSFKLAPEVGKPVPPGNQAAGARASR